MPFFELSNIFVQSYGDDFSRELAHNILINFTEVPKMNAEELAEKCMVSPSALRKFLKSINFGTYTEFRTAVQRLLKEGVNNSVTPGTPEALEYATPVIGGIRQELEYMQAGVLEASLFEAAKAILGREKVFLFSNSVSHAMLDLMYALFMLKKDVQIITLPKTYWDVAKLIDSKSTAIFIRAQPYSSHYSTSQMRDAAVKGGKSVFISSFRSHIDAESADHTIAFSGTGKYSFITTDMLIQMLKRALLGSAHS